MDTLKLTDYVDKHLLQDFSEQLYKQTGLAVRIFSNQHEMLAVAGLEEICVRFHREHNQTRHQCLEQEKYLSQACQTEETDAGHYRLRKCGNGLWDAALPIIVRQEQVATLFAGQFHLTDETVDIAWFCQQADKFNFPTQEYLETVMKAPQISREQVDTTMQLCRTVIALISQLADSNYALTERTAQHHNTQQILATNVASLSKAIDSIPCPMFIKNAQGVYIDCNENFAHLIFGAAKDQIVRNTIDDLMNQGLIPPNLALIYRKRDRELLEKQTMDCYETQVKCRDGELRDFYFIKNVYYNDQAQPAGIVGIMLDISEQKKTEQTLKQNLQRYRHITEVMTDYIYSVHFENGHAPQTVHSNKCIEITGYTPEDFDRDPYLWINMVHPDDQEHVKQQAQQACSGHSVEPLEHRIIHKSGEVRWVRNTIAHHFDSFGKLITYDGLIRDITAAKNAEIALQEAKINAETAQQEAEQINQQLQSAIEKANLMAHEALSASSAKSSFLANMSHEIRTPMNAILGFSEILAAESLTEDQLEYITIIRDSGQSLLAIINDILDFSKIEAGKIKLEVAECEISSYMAAIESLLKPTALRKNLTFDMNYAPDLPKSFYTDPVRLRQCLINLISNAIKFTNQGFVKIDLQTFIKRDTPWLRFNISDSGIGISSEQLNQIFQAFAQADCSTTRKYGGTGLGLTITKKLIEILGGNISVTSEKEKGSCFTLELPVFPATVNALPNSTTDQAPSTDHQVTLTNSGKILIAEDNPSNQKLITTLLNKLGFDITMRSDGQAALDALANNSFDLIILDMQMPNLNGYETAQRIRQMNIDTPILAVTAHAMKEDRQRCLNAGCNAYLAKPVEQESLRQAIAQLLTPVTT